MRLHVQRARSARGRERLQSLTHEHGRAALRRPAATTASRRDELFSAALVALPISFVVRNPWGLIGRHEIRLLIGFVAVAIALRQVVRRPEFRMPKEWRLGAAFLGSVALSTLFAADWRTTLIGHADRHLGLFGWIALGGAVLAGVNAGPSDRQRFRLALSAGAHEHPG